MPLPFSDNFFGEFIYLSQIPVVSLSHLPFAIIFPLYSKYLLILHPIAKVMRNASTSIEFGSSEYAF